MPLAALVCAIGAGASAPEAEPVDTVRLALVDHGGLAAGRCFSAGFLDLLAYETTIRVSRELDRVALSDERLFEYPLAILTGEGEVRLNDLERAMLARYLRSGGTMIVSAGCSNPLWAQSMRRELAEALPGATLAPVPREHPVFHAVFEVADLVTTKGRPGTLLGVWVGGRLALVYSPEGLNDTASAGGSCCCCGGDEIRQARFLNANLVAVALTR